MVIIIRFFAIALLLIFTSEISFGQIKNRSIIWENRFGENKCFVKNIGQYDNLLKYTNHIKYGVHNLGSNIFFSNKGHTYYTLIPKRENSSEEREKEHDEVPKYDKHKLDFEWIGSNSNVEIIESDISKDYFLFPKSSTNETLKVYGYKKIVYKNMYEKIDIEYIIHEKEGIKYSLVLNRGADISKVKFRYKNADDIYIDNTGALKVKTKLGLLTEYAPVSYYSNGEKVKVTFTLSKNEVSFKGENINNELQLIIDPWVVNPGFTTQNKAFDVIEDPFENIYVQGQSGSFYEYKKYSSAGVLLWSYLIPAQTYDLGDIATDITGSLYISEGGSYANRKIYKLSPSGALLWSYARTSGVYEMWRLANDRTFKYLYVAGGGNSAYPQIAKIDTVLKAKTSDVLLSTQSEIRSFVVDINGDAYNLHNDYSTFGNGSNDPTKNFVSKTNNALVEQYKTLNGYIIPYNGAYYGTMSLYHPFNGTAVNCNYFYTYDGSVLYKRNKITGASIGFFTVAGGSSQYVSGLAVDECNNIYSGGTNGIYKFDDNFSLLTSVPTSAVYDIYLSQKGDIIACGNGFVGRYDMGAAVCVTTLTTNTNSIPACSGNSGTASVSATGGTGNYSYYWLPGGQTNSTISNLAAGIYTVVITDSSCIGAITTANVIVANNCACSISATTNSTTNVICNGQSSGTATVGLINGSGGSYTYSWSGGSTTTTNATYTINSLSAGSYTVTIIDGSCTTTTFVNITQPSVLLAAASQQLTASCGMNNGVAIASASGGNNISYSYVWSNMASGATASGLISGTYTITVTDGNNCTNSTTVNINDSPAPVINNIIPVDPLCFNSADGSAVVNASGAGILSYLWSNGTTGITASNLSSGTYFVTVTDGSCTTTTAINITPPPPLLINPPTVTSAACGTPTGDATITASGGTGTSYDFTWSNNQSTNGSTQSTISGLSAGTYTVSVIDANLCVTSTEVLVNNNPSATIDNVITTSLMCNNSGNGSAVVTASGGTAPLTYSWSNGQNGQTTSNQQQGTYIVSVTDGNGCLTQSSVQITQPTAISASIANTNSASCDLNNGSANIIATGGTGTVYTYSWSNSQSAVTSGTSQISNLSSQTYFCTITDVNSCSYVHTFVIDNKPPPQFTGSSPAISPVDCKGNSSGMVDIIISGGTAPYTYSWISGQSISNNQQYTISNLSAGTYTISVIDNNACVSDKVIIITEPAFLFTSSITTVDPTCTTTGYATANISGGNTGNFTYSWSNGISSVTSSTFNFELLTPNSYTITITDSKGCITTTTATINNPPNAPTVQSVTSSNISCFGLNDGSASVIISGTGTLYTYSWSNGVSSITNSMQNTVVGLQSNTYTVTVMDDNACAITQSVTINEPLPLLLSEVTTNATCNQNNGSIAITTSGGNTGNYIYNFSNGASSVTTSNSILQFLVSNSYTITVTDSKGCTAIINTTINNTPLPTASASATVNIIDEGNSTTLNAMGGTSFMWTPITGLSCNTCQSPIASPNQTTTYTVIVTDNNSCNDTANVTIHVLKGCSGEEDIFIANVFSPNNDGKNDILYVQGNGLSNLYWAIYNRWGNLVFETTNQTTGWDGMYKNKPVDYGTYVYYLKGICKKNMQEVILKGNVSIVK